jgi:putative holliday junction resolvase
VGTVLTVLGFDVGAKRIGIAVGNCISMSAREVGVLDVFDNQIDWPSLNRWIKEWMPQTLVVGDPQTLDGGDQTSRQRARKFAMEIGKRYQLPVEQIDERNSSIEAAQRFAQARRAGAKKRHQAANLDALAAVIIVERWLNEPSARTSIDSSATHSYSVNSSSKVEPL